MAFDDWVDQATPADLDALAQALADGRIPDRPSSGSIQRAGFEDAVVRFMDGLGTVEPRVVSWMLGRLARERRAADDRYAQVARLVWSGASDDQEAIRDTRVVLEDLFARAERYVLIATYVVYDGRRIFARLAERLRARPGLQVEMFVNLDPNISPGDEDADVREYLRQFAAAHWPEDLPLPAIYYDPQAQSTEGKRTALHAKCVVVDDRWAFVTSANFTEAAQARNIEAGVLLDHPRLAAALAARFRALSASGTLKEMRA